MESGGRQPLDGEKLIEHLSSAKGAMSIIRAGSDVFPRRMTFVSFGLVKSIMVMVQSNGAMRRITGARDMNFRLPDQVGMMRDYIGDALAHVRSMGIPVSMTLGSAPNRKEKWKHYR